MAKRRMFSMQIVDTDAFLDMPATSQLLYFHLTMRADDEGFIGNPKKIMRLIGLSDDDMKILIAKRFILLFESGIVVVKHWLIHNTIRMDRFNKTTYKDEKEALVTKENKAYSEVATIGQPNGTQRLPQVKLSKANISKVSGSGDKSPTPSQTSNDFFTVKGIQEETIKELGTKGIDENTARKEIDKFVAYWTEPNSTGKKQRWQMQKTFDVKRRLVTWLGNVKQFARKKEVGKNILTPSENKYENYK